MWLIFALLALLAFAFADLFGKKCVGGGFSPLKLLVSAYTLAFCIGIALYAFRMGESGLAPWQILWSHPLLFVSQLCGTLYWLLFLLSMRFVGLAMMEAVSGATGVFYFSGLLAVSLATGKLSSMEEMLHPLRLIPILLVLVLTLCLPNTEVFAQRRLGHSLQKSKADRKTLLKGLLLLLLAMAFDAADSLITTVIFEEATVGAVDYAMTLYFSLLLPVVLFSLLLRRKEKVWYLPFRGGGTPLLAYSLFTVLSNILYLTSSSLDAVRTGILFIAYPIVPILGAGLLLKEKYTWRQNLCIWGITIASILFCLSDYLI